MFRTLAIRIATVFAALAMAIGLSSATAAPAQAAESVQFCFKWSTGYAYGYQPVFLMNANGTTAKSGKTASNGCAVFTGLSPSRNYYVQAYTVLVNGQIWNGYAPWYTGTGYGRANAGTGIVYRIA